MVIPAQFMQCFLKGFHAVLVDEKNV
ncbi:MAG: hypothetical protein RL509_414, partial [Pseudomonadota bacterium]